MRLIETIPIPDKRLLAALAIIPTLDCILNQITNVFHFNIATLSLLQVYRGLILIFFLSILGYRVIKNNEIISIIPKSAVLGVILLLIISSKELIINGSMTINNIVAYCQFLYWIIIWIAVSILAFTAERALILLKGIGIGSFLTAISVLYGYFYGGLNYYEIDDVHSSAGWFNTAKMISSVLITGAIVIIFLGRKKSNWICPLLSLTCFIACLLTYARAGTVAMAAVWIWLFIWEVRSHGQRTWISLNRFLRLSIISVLLLLFLSTHSLFSRWNDLSEGDKAGSGRATIWNIAVNAFLESRPSDQIFGHGYNSMSEILLQQYGDDVKHTHNDFLDLLITSGSIGILWLSVFVGGWIYRIFTDRPWTPEGGAALAVLINYICHSMLTGQIWGTDAMTYYVVSLTAFNAFSRQRDLALQYRHSTHANIFASA